MLERKRKRWQICQYTYRQLMRTANQTRNRWIRHSSSHTYITITIITQANTIMETLTYLKFSTSFSGTPFASTSSVDSQYLLPSGVITMGCESVKREREREGGGGERGRERERETLIQTQSNPSNNFAHRHDKHVLRLKNPIKMHRVQIFDIANITSTNFVNISTANC